MEQQSFGYWLKLKRKALDLTREALAKRVGYSAATVRKIEDEERRPSVEVAQRLADVFHISSGERESFLHFARGDSITVPTETTEAVPWRASTKVHRSNIPATTTSLIARQDEIAQVHGYLSQDDVRLVTLMGPPGIGKTRLSIETARAVLPDFPDGVFFVALAPLSDPTRIAASIVHTLGYVGAKNLSPEEQLMDGIGGKQILLVLDNCEHLIEDVASLATALLSACSRLKLLTTSRESLRIAGEWLYPVPAFTVPKEIDNIDLNNVTDFPALTLFAERARAVRPDFRLDGENIKTVSAICAHLDGLPLVIELIAARIRLMSPQALLERLNDQFILTADGMRAASVRQKTLNHAIGWSYNLLSADEQKLFVRLSVFSDEFTLEDIESIFSKTIPEKAVSELVMLLLDKSLLQHVTDRAASVGRSPNPTYMMLVTIREFARDRLQEKGEEVETRNRHLAYFLDIARQADQELRGPNQLRWLSRLDRARDDLRAALSWAAKTGKTDAALDLALSLHWFWFVRGDHIEGRKCLEHVLGLPETPLYPDKQAQALTQLAHHTWLQIGPKEARPYAEQALILAQEHNDRRNLARALTHLGLVSMHENNFAVAEAQMQESRKIFQELDDQWNYAHSLICLATNSYRQEDWVHALDLFEQVLQAFNEVGDRYFQSAALRFLGILQVRLGNQRLGMKALREALILAKQMDSKYEISMILWQFAEATKHHKQFTRAVSFYSVTKDLLDSMGAWTQGDEMILQNDMAPCRAALGEREFTGAEAQGRAMTMEQAIVYALENIDE